MRQPLHRRDVGTVRDLRDKVLDTGPGPVSGACEETDDEVELPVDDHRLELTGRIGPVVSPHPQPRHDLVPGRLRARHVTVALSRPLHAASSPRRGNAVPGEIRSPTLIVHGTRDTFVPIESSRSAAQNFRAPCELVEIDGAQHGFAVHDDPGYLDSQSQEWQAFVIRTLTDWLARNPSRDWGVFESDQDDCLTAHNPLIASPRSGP